MRPPCLLLVPSLRSPGKPWSVESGSDAFFQIQILVPDSSRGKTKSKSKSKSIPDSWQGAEMGGTGKIFGVFKIFSEFFKFLPKISTKFWGNLEIWEKNPRNCGKMSVLTVCSLSGILANYPESLPGEKYQIQILLQKTKSKSSGSRILTL